MTQIIDDDTYKAQLQAAHDAAFAAGRESAMQWLPIESAPKDGHTILLGYFNSRGNWRTLRGRWFSHEVIKGPRGEPEDCDGLEGWYETSVEADELPNDWVTKPTHWMSLPGAPK